MSIITRNAQPSDLMPLRQLAIDSFTKAYAQFNTEQNMTAYLSENFSEEKLLEEINAEEILLGLQDEKIVAYAKLVNPNPAMVQEGNPLEIARLYTLPEAIGQRIGVRMINAIANLATERGYDSLCLGAWQKNYRAINFYQREEFKITGVTKFVFGDDVQNDFIMLKKLGQEEIILETERLYLRKFIPKEDAAFLVELVNSPKWLKFIGDRNIHTEEEAIKSMTVGAMKSYAIHGHGGYVIIEKTSGERVGHAGLYRRPILEHADVGYALLPEFEGKGYAFEAAQGVMQHARDLKMKHIYGITVAYHERSIHLLEKLGLKFEMFFRMEGDPEELSLYGISLENG